MKLKRMTIHVSDFKADVESGTFTCYGNVKGNIDHAKDRTMPGAYQKSIEQHAKDGTMPLMLWMHNPHLLPVGKWLEWREDEKGLWMKGKLSDTTMGKDLKVLAKDDAVYSFSIGYYEIDSKWNADKGCNDLYELDIKEVSWVTFACNEESTLESVKSHLHEGELPTKRELQSLLRESGLSKSEAERICNMYNPTKEVDIKIDVANMQLFS